ncbi:hypothetical protein ACXYMO_16605 [Arenibacterium sp. CAU 1754]
MPRIIDTLYGRDAYDISGWWHPDHDLTKANLSRFNVPSDDMLPLHIKLATAPNILPGLTSLATNMIYADAQARAILERFEPGKLRFSPVVVHMPKGRLYDGEISLLTLPPSCLVKDGLVREQLDVRLVENYRIPIGGGKFLDGKPYLRPTHEPPRLMWNRRTVGDRHIWADDMLPSKIIISDELYAALKEAGVTGYQAQESRFATEQ